MSRRPISGWAFSMGFLFAAGTVAILGAGTGFGVSALVREGSREAVLTTEGGHVSLAPVDDLVDARKTAGERCPFRPCDDLY